MEYRVLIAIFGLLCATPSTNTPCSSIYGSIYQTQSCCKICKKGKPCGDSCIALDKSCSKGKGCACNKKKA